TAHYHLSLHDALPIFNAQDNAFGNGFLDGYSVVAGHEYSEAVTDPGNLSGYQDGWNDAQTSENGDKCAWTGLANITLAGQQFARSEEHTSELQSPDQI